MDNSNTKVSTKSASGSPDPGNTTRALSSVSDTLSGSTRVNSPTSNAPKAILSCDFCRQRKTKCDKAEGGCSNCKRAGIKCNMPTRQRLPRGRNGGRTKVDAELKARVGRLENLVRTLGGKDRLGDSDALERALSNTSMSDKPTCSDRGSPKEPNRKTSSSGSDFGRYLGSSFWTSLTDEITGLRGVLDDDSDEDLEPEDSSRSTPSRENQLSSASNTFTFVLCTSDGMFVNPDVLQHPPKVMVSGLCSLYLRAVDPVFKLVHAPSLARFLQNGEPYLHYSPNDPAPQALAFAVYYAALGAQSDQDCRENFGESKAVLVSRYRVALEAALSRADLLITTDITVLSAFLLLIIFTRVSSNDRRPWTLLSLALRIAQAIGLPREDPQSTISPFWKEIRRRVWNAVNIIDGQSAGDRGTEPLISHHHDPHPLATPKPLNINDADMSFDGTDELKEREGITDTSFPLVCRTADEAAIELDFNAAPEWCDRHKLAFDWETRKDFATEWRRTMHEKFLKHCDTSQKMDQVIYHVIEIISIDMLLTAIRPLQKHPKMEPPRVSGDYILSLTASTLERSAVMINMPAFKDFLWFGRQYNQWHTIAVMAAELCVHSQGAAVERAWAILDRSLDFYKQIIADSEKGMLWRPIEKLLKKARETRNQALGPQSSNTKTSYPTSEGFSFPVLDMTSPRADSKPQVPQSANAAMAFTSFQGPSIGLPSLGLDNKQGLEEADQWQLPSDFMKTDMNFDQIGNVTNEASPENGWQNWSCFTDDLQTDDQLFQMQVDNMSPNNGISKENSPFPWFFGTSTNL